MTVLGDRQGTIDIQEKRRKIGLVSSAFYVRVPPRETLFDVVLSGRYTSLGIYEESKETDLNRTREIVAFLGCVFIAECP